MRRIFGTEFIFQLFALVIAVIIVHAVYVAVIRPNAAIFNEQQQQAIEAAADQLPEQSIYVILRDYEQEVCFILLLWACAIMGYKAWTAVREYRLLYQDLIPLADGVCILPEDTRAVSRVLQSLPEKDQQCLLPRALITGLHRFEATKNIQNVSTAVIDICEGEAERLESELSMIRYIAWAIPSIGFIGTVRGIGQALGQAHQAVEGDITGVTQSLGVAFNSTLIALVLSIILMFLLHQLQLSQERLVQEAEAYCDHHLIRHLQVDLPA